MPWKYKERIIKEGRAWQDDYGIQHPSSWMRWSAETKASRGLIWEEPPEFYDDRFYFGRDLDGNLIPRYLEELKAGEIAKIKQTASSLLSSTDWYVVREVEEGTNCPINIKNYRREVRAKSNEIENLINKTSSIDELKALMEVAEGEEAAPINNWPKLEDLYNGND